MRTAIRWSLLAVAGCILVPAFAADDKKPSGIPGKGETGYIEVEGETTVWVSIDERALDELNAFSRASNEDGIKQMMQQGRVLVCSKGTKVSVVDPGLLSTTIRIMEGKHSGKTGIIPNEFLHKKSDKDKDKEKMVSLGDRAGKISKIEDGGKYFSLMVEVSYLEGRNVRTKEVEVPCQFGDGCKIRLPNPPPAFDDKGKPKKYTAKELKDLRGGLPGYPGDFSNLKNGQVVKVSLERPKPPASKPMKKDKDKKEEDALTETRPFATMIIIVVDTK